MNQCDQVRRSVLALLLSVSLAGCASMESTAPGVISGVSLQGSVHGGQQPLANTALQLYAAGTAGYGSTATPLLKTPVYTDAHGNFTLSGDFTCPANAMVYLAGSGGNPGVSGSHNNSGLALMVGLGACSNLTSSTYIAVNELTTVATVWALAPFMNSATQVGTTAGNAQGLSNAFAAINKLVDTRTGQVGGPALPAGATLPVSQINLLADVLAACVNTVDDAATSSQSSVCQALFNAAAVGGSTPGDTVQAALNLAHNPKLSLSALTNLVPVIAPFQPTPGSPPSSWQIAINYTGGGLKAPSGVAVDSMGNVWLANAGNNSVTRLANSGAPVSPASGYQDASLSTPSAIAIDTAGSAWVTNRGNNTVTRFNSAGLMSGSFTGGGMSSPSSISLDAVGNVWISNYETSSVTELSSSGTALSGSVGYSAGGITRPVGLAVQPR